MPEGLFQPSCWTRTRIYYKQAITDVGFDLIIRTTKSIKLTHTFHLRSNMLITFHINSINSMQWMASDVVVCCVIYLSIMIYSD